MASPLFFTSAPPFPDDVPVAQIARISLEKLANKDAQEAKAVFDACTSLGFFLLDLRGNSVGEELIKDVDAALEATGETMDIGPRRENALHSTYAQMLFWGIMKTKNGKPDRCEFYVVTQDDILHNPSRFCIKDDDPFHTHPFPNPPPIESRRHHLEGFVNRGQYAITLVLRAFSTQLGLPENIFRERMQPDQSSGTIIRLIRSAPSLTPEEKRTGLVAHTDYGSITLLANVTGGLQVLRPDADPSDERGWEYVKPEPGCLIVNIADAMVQWTGGVLRSNMHRVNFVPGTQALVPRHSVALLVRPQMDTRMSRIVGGRIPLVSEDGEDKAKRAEELKGLSAIVWERRKAMALREGRDIMKSRGGRALQPLAAV
ncbi:Clavaminate synthase-like protein [Viridothelium virens]|uniref:Clavaminate synthase-like protein n=1 Tax=Viridothelium virens TaxID=1048519 RepID=A0A6A6HCJ0_VIRVR|nr:Clavaminate synthase-like protein [Viridothelium virens]